MSKLAVTAALPILSLLVLCACTRARGADDYTAFVYAGCSQARYDAGSQYAADVDTVLSSLTNSAGDTAYANYTSPSAATGLVGVYQCRSDLPAAICGCCVRSAVSKLSSLCNSAAGAAVQLRACFVRYAGYGNDSSLGRQDTTVLFKKCGGDGGDAGVVAMRDAALGALVASAAPADEGSYRAGAAGYVQAMSQCVGDLGAKACSDCVSAAASQLKAGCGYASAGEVYLGKCYARFWSNAGTGASNGGGISGGGSVGGGGAGAGAGNGYAYGSVPHTCGDVHDESGKTITIIMSPIAIILSPVAAFALAIIFSFFVKQAALVIFFLFFVRRPGSVGGFEFDEQAQDNVGQDSRATRPFEDFEQGDPSPAGIYPEWDDGYAGTDATAGGEGNDYEDQGELGAYWTRGTNRQPRELGRRHGT